MSARAAVSVCVADSPAAPARGAEANSTIAPYFAAAGARLFCDDVLRALNALPDKCADLIFADPPYNLSNDGFTCHAGRRVSVNKGGWDKSRGAAADFAFHDAWLAACRRVLTDNGTLWVSGTYHSIFACGFALQQQGWRLLNDIVWYKPNAAPHLACRMFAASHETLLWASKGKTAKHYFDYALAKSRTWEGDFMKKPDKQMRSVWAIGTPKPHEKRHGKHPTQKPEALLTRIVETCCRPGDLVLDPFCGSATTGVAALQLGRRFIGIERERAYLDDYAIPRLTDALGEDALLDSASRQNADGLLP